MPSRALLTIGALRLKACAETADKEADNDRSRPRSGAWLLQRVVCFSRAAEMSFTSEALSADEALACGLVSRVVEDAAVLDTTRELARKIAANPPHAVRMTKRLMMQARDVRLETLLEFSAAMQSLTHTTADHREAVLAFRGKRRPEFKGL